MHKISWEMWRDPLETFIHKCEHDHEDFDENEPNKHKLGTVLVGPMGIMSIDRNTLASNKVQFWEANMNFDLSQPVLEAIAKVEGVETLRPLTRYKFIVSFGKVFVPKEVMANIDGLFAPKVQATTKVDRLDLAKKRVSHLENWAVCVFPNGKIESVGDVSRQVVFDRIKEFKETQGVKLYTAWD